MDNGGNYFDVSHQFRNQGNIIGDFYDFKESFIPVLFSPFIDSGNNENLLSEVDLANHKRIWDGDSDGSAIVDMGAYEFGAPPLENQQIDFISGWNIFSSNILPLNKDLKVITKALIDKEELSKIQDETGNSLEDMGVFGGWINKIGNIDLTEGYKIKVLTDCSLSINGYQGVLPLKIPLKTGWNIIGYPLAIEVNGITVVQQLIDRNTLLKVQDEAGNSIEDYGVFGGWQNNIGNFMPGEGYKIKLNADDTLTIFESYPKSLSISNQSLAAIHFQSVSEGNGVDHMNINLINLPARLLHPGDEIGVFDGNLCVGAATLMTRNLENSTISIPVTSLDNMGGKGFTEGNPISLRVWKASTKTEYPAEPEIIKGSSTFVKHESTFISLEKFAITGLSEKPEPAEMGFKVYPNPTNGKVYVYCFGSSTSRKHISVLNVLGQKVLDKVMNVNPEVIDLSGKVLGVYYVRVTGDSISKTEKIILR